jgi:hypothetical protein
MAPISSLWIRQLAAFCLVSSVFASARAADIAHCDRYLPVSTNNAWGYRLRGDRCEGVYIQPVSATPLIVASFGHINAPDVLPANAELLVEWAPAGREVRLRATSSKPKAYYRMDSLQPAKLHSYRWPADVLAALKLSMKDIGVVAWTQQKVGMTIRDVYLPVSIGRPLAGPDTLYDLVLVPGDELNEVFVSLSELRAGTDKVPLSDAKPLKYGFYPAGRSIRIPIGPVTKPGTYLVEIAATLRGGGAVSYELWFAQGPISTGR